MAKISTGYTFGLTKTQFLACEMIFSGKSAREVARLLFPCNKKDTLEEDPSKVEYYARTIRKWMKDEKFKDCYKALLKELAYSTVGSSLQRLTKQLADNNGWLANKAANDILNKLYAVVMDENQNQVVVKVEGMPELGEPDKSDAE